MTNHYFDDQGVYTMSWEAYPGTLPPDNALRVPLPEAIPEGFVPVVNLTRDGWELVEDHRGDEGWLNGEWLRWEQVGPLPEGWATDQPDSRSPEEKRLEAAQGLANAALMRASMKAVAETADLSDAELAAVGTAGYLDEWAPGMPLWNGKRFVHAGVTYICLQGTREQPMLAQAHQRPGGEGMLAVYRPVDGAAGTRDDPKTLLSGMDAVAGLYYRYGGGLWRCLRDLMPTHAGRMPGELAGYWERVETPAPPVMTRMAAAPAVIPQAAHPEPVYRLNSTGKYHTADCTFAAEAAEWLTLAQITARHPGATPCQHCRPPALEGGV